MAASRTERSTDGPALKRGPLAASKASRSRPPAVQDKESESEDRSGKYHSATVNLGQVLVGQVADLPKAQASLAVEARTSTKRGARGRLIGTLTISKGGVTWVASGGRKYSRSWTEFAEVMATVGRS